MREKGFTLPLVIVAVSLGIIVVGVIGYSQFKSRSLQQPQTTQTITRPKSLPTQATPPTAKDETANWKIYRNEEYGFEVRYPLEWQVLDFKSTTPKVSIPLVVANAKLSERDFPTTGEIELNFYTFNETWPDLDSFINEWGLPANGAERVVRDHNQLVGNYLAEGSEITENDVIFYSDRLRIAETPAIRQILECKKFCVYLLSSEGIQISYFLVHNQRFYKIWAQLAEREDRLEKILNQILSTFKFLE